MASSPTLPAPIDALTRAAAPRAEGLRLPAARAAAAAAPPLLVGLATLLIGAPALWNDFVEWDDTVNFLDNPHYRGLGWAQLRWMFTAVLMGQWIPLTWITLGADYLLWGMQPAGYHLTSLLFHAATAVAFYALGHRLLALTLPALPLARRRLGAAGAALFFAVHPLRAESVAWVTERRDVVSGLFFVLTVLAYLRAADGTGRRRGWLVAAVVLHALAGLGKATVVMLPVVLTILDVYPLRRLPASPARWLTPAARAVWREKVPFLAVSLAVGVMAVYAQVANTFLTPLERLPLLSRPVVALFAIAFYPAKTAFPLGFSPIYELPASVSPLEPRFALSAAAVVLATAILVAVRRRWPAGLAAWAAYLVLLLPVSGLIHNGFQLAHDRYSYLATMPFAILFGAALALTLDREPSGRLRAPVLALARGTFAVWLAGLALLSGHQVQVWRDTDTLWRFAIESEPDCAICHGNLGVLLVNQGLDGPAVPHFERALALRGSAQDYSNLGVALVKTRPAEALQHLEQGLARTPTDVPLLRNVSYALFRLGREAEAERRLRAAIATQPGRYELHNDLGLLLMELGRLDEALESLHRSAGLKPDATSPHAGLARVYARLGRWEAALERFEFVRTRDPKAALKLAPALDLPW